MGVPYTVHFRDYGEPWHLGLQLCTKVTLQW